MPDAKVTFGGEKFGDAFTYDDKVNSLACEKPIVAMTT